MSRATTLFAYPFRPFFLSVGLLAVLVVPWLERLTLLSLAAVLLTQLIAVPPGWRGSAARTARRASARPTQPGPSRRGVDLGQ